MAFNQEALRRPPHWRVKLTRDLHSWWNWWTPVWHNGRGPYISVKIGPLLIWRGY